jgi:hypothetical protein
LSVGFFAGQTLDGADTKIPVGIGCVPLDPGSHAPAWESSVPTPERGNEVVRGTFGFDMQASKFRLARGASKGEPFLASASG